jgi:adenylate kinase family enzyme
MPDRIAVVGISGSGKSTFARALAQKLKLPLHFGDHLDWLPNWGVRPQDDLNAMHAAWVAESRWIIEGWIDTERVSRLNTADVVVDLDFSRWVCFSRVVQRQIRGVRRDEMPEGCIDRFSARTLLWVLLKSERPFIDAALKAATMKSYVRLKSPREADAWLAAL